MEDNAFDKLKSMMNNGNIPEEFQNIISNMNSSNSSTDSSNKNSGISPEAISNLMNMLNKNNTSDNTKDNSSDSSPNSGYNIDFETIMKLKNVMDKMNSKDDPRSKLLISLKPYLKDNKKNKIDQYIQFLNISRVMEMFTKSSGDDK